MYATIRTYENMPGVTDKLATRRTEIEKLLQSATGFISYYMLKTDTGMLTVTICKDKTGTDESNRLAATWLKENMPELTTSPPKITGGDVVIHTAVQGAPA